jgi:hypothetical protein
MFDGRHSGGGWFFNCSTGVRSGSGSGDVSERLKCV